MKIGIVGCGLNSDYHINFARGYAGADIIGVVDRDSNKASECAARFDIKGVYPSIKEMIAGAGKPDVIHILTPPKTHFALAKEAMEAGCHVIVEKPFTLNATDARALYDLAEKKNVKVCTMHNHFFDPCMAKADELIKAGRLGEVINVESYYGLNTNIPALRDYPEPNVIPWLYDLPGGVYQDFMPHPLYVLLEYTGRPKETKVMFQTHNVLPQGMPDEIRVLVNGEKAFGTLTFSFAARPHLHFIRVYGTKMMVEVDINTMTTVTHPLSSLPKAAQKATYNLAQSWQLFTSTFSNVINFVTGKLKPYQGMKVLIHRFYASIENNTEPPVTKEQALLVMDVMDEIFRQLEVKPLVFEDFAPAIPPYPVKHREKVLVTGGTGFLGKRLVDGLVKEGYPLRVLARKLSNIERLKKTGAEVFFGDVADEATLAKALEGINVVIHAAAGTSGNKKDCDTATIRGTENILMLCRAKGVDKLVYISSCSVYGVADYKTGQLVAEDAALERFPEKRGEYSASKQRAEGLVAAAMKDGLKAVILRPGTIFGPGGDVYTPMLGFSAGSKAFIVIGNGKFELPLVYVDNLVDAIIKSVGSAKADNGIFNVVDGERVDKRRYMKGLIKRLYPGAKVFYFPFSLLYLMTFGQEILCKLIKRGPFLTRYRLISSQRNIRYDNARIIGALGWKPKVSMEDAFERIIDFEKKRV